MKTIAAGALALLVGGTPALAASPAEGLWRTPTNNGEVLIAECGHALCGKITTSDRIKLDPNLTDNRNKDASLRGRPLKDLQILTGFTGGPPQWKGGQVYNPEDGGTYKGSMKLVDPDTLRLTGCIFAPLCKTEVWRRVK